MTQNFFDMLQTNPMWQQGLATLANVDPQEQLVRAQLEAMQTERANAEAYQMKAAKVDWANMTQEDMSGLMQHASPDQGLKIYENWRKAQAAKQEADFFYGPDGGASGDASGGIGGGMGGGADFTQMADEELVKFASHPTFGPSAAAELQRRQKTTEGERNADKDYFSRVDTLGKGFIKDAEPYLSKIEDYQNSLSLAQQANESEDGIADYQLMKMAVQIHDKKASAVTDGEADQVINSGGLENRFGNLFSGYAKGTKFTPEQRQNILKVVRSAAKNAETKVNSLKKGYGNRASSAKVKEEDVFSPYNIPSIDELEAEYAPPVEGEQFDDAEGKSVTFKNGGFFYEDGTPYGQ